MSTTFKRFSSALVLTALLALGSIANADIFTGAGDGTSWEDPLNWAAGVVPANNSTNILINGDHDVVYSAATWDFLQINGLAQSATQHRVSRFLLNENTGAGPLGVNSITFDFADPNDPTAVRELLATNATSSVWGGRPGTETVINLISGTVNTGSRDQLGGRADAVGVLNITGGTWITGRSNMLLGSAADLTENGSTGILNISGGSLLTREGLAIGATSTMNVMGSSVVEIGIGSQGTVDGFWQQRAGGVLAVGLDAGGITPIFVDDVGQVDADGNNIGGDGIATFAAGSILDPSDLGGFTTDVWVTVMTAEGGIVGAPTLTAAAVAAGWESRIVGNDLEVMLVGGGAPLKGDINMDGEIDFFDIQPFIDVLSAGGNQPEADVDCDGAVTFFDIQPFIDLLAQ